MKFISLFGFLFSEAICRDENSLCVTSDNSPICYKFFLSTHYSRTRTTNYTYDKAVNDCQNNEGMKVAQLHDDGSSYDILSSDYAKRFIGSMMYEEGQKVEIWLSGGPKNTACFSVEYVLINETEVSHQVEQRDCDRGFNSAGLVVLCMDEKWTNRFQDESISVVLIVTLTTLSIIFVVFVTVVVTVLILKRKRVSRLSSDIPKVEKIRKENTTEA